MINRWRQQKLQSGCCKLRDRFQWWRV